MTFINNSMEIRGTAPRSNFDIVHTQDDGEDRWSFQGEPFDAEYDRYIHPMATAGSKPQLLS